jgi:hypothetical protein
LTWPLFSHRMQVGLIADTPPAQARTLAAKAEV